LLAGPGAFIVFAVAAFCPTHIDFYGVRTVRIHGDNPFQLGVYVYRNLGSGSPVVHPDLRIGDLQEALLLLCFVKVVIINAHDP